MNGLMGGRLFVGGLGPGPPATPSLNPALLPSYGVFELRGTFAFLTRCDDEQLLPALLAACPVSLAYENRRQQACKQRDK